MSFDKKTKILSGIEIPPFYHPNVTIGEAIMHYLQRAPDRIVQTCYDDGVELTGAEVMKLAKRIAGSIAREGFRLGDVIGLVCKNTTYVASTVLGCFLVGCPVSTMDPTFDVSEIANIFRQTKPKFVFCDHDNWRNVVEALKQCENQSEAVTVDEKLLDVRHITEFLQLAKGEKEFIPRGFGVDSSKLCSVILCSSGTTGASKGTMLSSMQCLQIIGPLGITHPTIISFSSLYWLSGLLTMLYSLANGANRIITKRKFSPLLICHLIEKYKVNVVLTPPSQVALLLNSPVIQLADLSSVRRYFIGGGFISQHLRQSLQDHLLYGSIFVTYAMTETCALVSSTQPFQLPSNSSGKICPNMKIKVIDEDGNSLDVNEIGEIHILAPTRFIGYASNPQETKNSFDSSGWLKTGDLGYVTEDGEVFIVDRKKDMIKYMNYQVAPSELEAFITKMEGVINVCVVGIPDMISGDLAAAVIVKDSNSLLTEQDVVDDVARHFPQFKRLHGGVYFMDAIPMTPSGKVKKMIVKKHVAQLYRTREINGNY